MKIFRRQLADRSPVPRDRRWIFVPYDQLSDRIGPLAELPASDAGIVLVESPWKASLRPYHKHKLALVLSNLRHFALEQAERGVAVRHLVVDGPYREALRPLARELGRLVTMEPAERELRADLEPLVEEGLLQVVPHEGWLTSADQFERSQGKEPPWRMDSFYRLVRRESGILMDGGRPVGGKFSFDAENRRPWRGEPKPPTPPRFRADEITREVAELVERRFARHPGEVLLDQLPSSASQARSLWRWAVEECLPTFGPFEDAMSERSTGLFHTRISPLLNLHRLLAREVVREAAGRSLPLASQEGFIRQVLGWREFVRHAHRATDGFRRHPSGGRRAVASRPGDGGWSRWRGERWPRGRAVAGVDGGARPSWLRHRGDLPAAFWGSPSGLRCLDRVVEAVWGEAWSHHITRLMILANLATLLSVEPRQLADWFWCAYADAYDWVVEPNVLAMGSFALGELMTTKPYVSGSAYIRRMSDYCAGCRFDPDSDCPITPLYWHFLARHRKQLEKNPRMGLVLRGLERRGGDQRRRDRRIYEVVSKRLAGGLDLSPSDLP